MNHLKQLIQTGLELEAKSQPCIVPFEKEHAALYVYTHLNLRNILTALSIATEALEYCANGPKPYTLEGFRTKAKGALRDIGAQFDESEKYED